MTEFFIKGISAVLPKDISFSLIDENAEITNNGSFTWDIELSLMNPVNAKIFKHINRLNINSIEIRMDATLIVDNKVRRGSIVVLSTTEKSVSIQFLSGNSELNYIAKNERKIWELGGLNGWGEESTISLSRAVESLSYSGYGPLNFVCAPVKTDTVILNDYTLTAWNASNPFSINGISGKIVMQPYLLYYINKLPELLGYTLLINILNDDSRAKKMYLINVVDSMNYADSLPDMTISEFITAIENFFNVSFIVDGNSKTISIVRLQSNMTNKRLVSLEKVLDQYTRSLEETEKSLRLSFTRLSYDLSSSDYFKYQKISEDILQKCTIKDFENYDAIKNYLINTEPEGSTDNMVIFRDNELQRDYFYYWSTHVKIPTVELCYRKLGAAPQVGAVKATWILSVIDKFASTNTDLTKELSLQIIPASIYINNLSVAYNSTSNYDLKIQMPKSSNSYYKSTDEHLIESIENGISNTPRVSKLEVALYSGMINPFCKMNANQQPTALKPYPFSHIDNFPEMKLNITMENDVWYINQFLPTITTSLRLKGNGSILADYTQQSILDTSKEYTFDFIEEKSVSANDLFSIKNKTYMPISLERTVGINGFGKVVKTKCYALK